MAEPQEWDSFVHIQHIHCSGPNHQQLATDNTLLTSRGVVWDTLQLLYNVDVQQLERKKILTDKQEQTVNWKFFLAAL